MKRYILKKDNHILLLLFDGNRCIEIRCFETNNAPVPGQIIIGRVKDVVEHIGAAFVDIGQEKNAYLSFEDIGPGSIFAKKISKKPIVSGDEIVVQVVKEPMGTKPYCVTGKLSISGKGVVVSADKKASVNISKKIKPEKMLVDSIEAFKESMKEDYSIILRTNAPSMDAELLDKELLVLWARMKEIHEVAAFRTSLSTLYSPLSAWMTEIRDTRSEMLDEIITDDDEIYEGLKRYEKELGIGNTIIRKYIDTYPLRDNISLYSLVKDIRSKIAWMKSGAYLVIEQTEALCSIDVNSGKAEKKSSADEFYLQINLDAAREAAKQIRLRNLSGIILIDFINMRSDEDRQAVTKVLSECFRADGTKTVIAGFTKLGLMEITREKKFKPIAQMPIEIF